MRRRLRSRSALAVLSAVLVLGVACTNAEGPVCELSDYATDIQAELNALAGMDSELVAQAGTPENTAALAAIDSLTATQEAAQGALDDASNDEVGPVVRGAFQLILDTTEAVVGNLSTAIASGDAGSVESALDGVQAVSDAIGAFEGIVEGLGIECAAASPSASVAASASVAPSVAPTPVVTATPEPTAAPTATPEPTETEEPDETPEATATAAATTAPTAVPTAVPTATPSPTPTPSPSASASASASGSGSPEPSPSPSAEPDDEQGGLLPWIIILGLLGTGAAAIVLWYTNRNEPPPDDGMTGADDPGSMGAPPPAGPPPAAPPPASPPPSA